VVRPLRAIKDGVEPNKIKTLHRQGFERLVKVRRMICEDVNT
jgi:hypothetical protein